MANPEHVAVVGQGVAALKEWQRLHPREQPDEHKLDLREADLGGVDLTGADLRAYRFDGANLRAADLRGANLLSATLRHADLRDARLDMADLLGASLDDADLRHASLMYTVFEPASLTGANFEHAFFHCTRLLGCDLSGCIGLDGAGYGGPCAVDVGTLEKTLRGGGGTFGPVLQEFFFMVGVAEELVDYLPRAFANDPFRFYTCFISYAEADEPFPSRLYEYLRRAGVKCWKFSDSAVLGRSLWGNIDRAIQTYDKLVVVCSERSLNRPAVLDEIERALQKEASLRLQRLDNPTVDADVLFPVRIDDYVFKGWQHERKADLVAKVIGDFKDNVDDSPTYQRELQRLLHALNPKSWEP